MGRCPKSVSSYKSDTSRKRPKNLASNLAQIAEKHPNLEQIVKTCGNSFVISCSLQETPIGLEEPPSKAFNRLAVICLKNQQPSVKIFILAVVSFILDFFV